jgi:2-amino-4-hydroxy-6-hydroxymethyldihydropteridine diphosphokinase
MRTGVALGSNLGDRLGNLKAARDAISRITGIDPPIIASPIYETEPVDCEPGAPGFLNAAIEFGYNGEIDQLFDELRRVEAALGRPAEHERNVSRPIDIDLLYFGDAVLATEALTLPHPRISKRRFVLQPLADIQPNLLLAGQTKTIRELLASAPRSAKVLRATAQWEDR